jgi:hypothetical protein
MPKGAYKQQPRNVAQMSGQDFGLEVARDLFVLPKEERNKAIRFINVMNDTIERETEALATK